MEICRHRLVAVAAALLLAAAAIAAPGDGALPPAIATVTHTTAAELELGAQDGVAVCEADSSSETGHLRLEPRLNDLFLATDLDPRWVVTQPSGFAPVIEGGILDVQERDDDVFERSAIESQATFTAGVVCEMRALIEPGSAFCNIGFMSSTETTSQWAYFSTRGSGDGPVPVIKTSVRGAAGGNVDVPTAVTLGQWHVFRIEWTPGEVAFLVDGELLDTRTDVDLTLPQRVAWYKTDGSSSPLLVDWVRVTPYAAPSGEYTSPVMDAGAAGTPWTTVAWEGTTPAGSTVAVATRTGATGTPGAGWSDWAPLGAGGVINSPVGRYAQYRATLTTGDAASSPEVDAIHVAYSYPDLTAPTVAGTAPAPDATGVAVHAAVEAVFSEAVDPSTVTAASFTLRAVGGAAIVATVTLDDGRTTAILSPSAVLAHATQYEARLGTEVTDLDGNPLAADHVWRFTTGPADVTAPAVITTDPAGGAVDVAPGRMVSATFSEPIDPNTLTAAGFTLTVAGGASVAATVSYDVDSRRALLTPTSDLVSGTSYEARITTNVTDLAGNPLATDAVWTFSTRYGEPIVVRATAAADFSAGDLTGLVVAEIDSSTAGGQLRLQSRLDDRFDQPTLAAHWRATRPEDYVPVIENGILDVQERDDDEYVLSAIESVDAWGPSVMLEVRGMFVPGSRFIDIGLDSSTNGNGQYAWFSTAGSGDEPGEEQIFARIREYNHDTVALPTGITYNEWHVFKIIWTPGHLEFFCDDMLVAQRSNVLITAPLRAAFYKSGISDTPLLIDWARVTPLTEAAGTYRSPIVDSGTAETVWYELDWVGSAPTSTTVAVATRTGATAAPDASWSAWALLGDQAAVASPAGRYLQYQASLSTLDPFVSPTVDEFVLGYRADDDHTPPEVLTVAPASLAVDVDLDATVTATFSEPLAPASLNAESFSLVPEGGAALPAEVAWDAATRTAILTPSANLPEGALLEARLATTVADTAGNGLAAAYSWYFRTVESWTRDLPTVTVLRPCMPNPFNAGTRVSFDLARGGDVRLRIFGIDGRLVRTLINSTVAAGQYAVIWDGNDDDGAVVASGVYVARLETAESVQHGKMVMLK